MARPKLGDFPPPAKAYINQTQEETIGELLVNYSACIQQFVANLPESKANFAYAEGKWTIKDLLQHLIDTERIFSYRLLRIARQDATALPGFEENDYAEAAKANNRTLKSLQDEFFTLRLATDFLVQSIAEEDWQNQGTMSGYSVTANALAFIIFGHNLHHIKVLQQRYL